MNRKINPTGAVIYVLILALLFLLVYQFFSGVSSETTPYSQVVELFETGAVRSFTLSTDGALRMEVAGETGTETVTTTIGDVNQFHRDLDDLIAAQHRAGTLEDYNYPAASRLDWVSLLPYLILGIGLVYVIILLVSRSGGGQNSMGKFTRANVRIGSGSSKPVTFADVAGADEEKEELEEVVAFLKDPDRFTRLGARIPKGILLVGPPGTARTLLARAVAGEAGVQFLSISGSDFVELYVGVGASRVRDPFEQAK